MTHIRTNMLQRKTMWMAPRFNTKVVHRQTKLCRVVHDGCRTFHCFGTERSGWSQCRKCNRGSRSSKTEKPKTSDIRVLRNRTVSTYTHKCATQCCVCVLLCTQVYRSLCGYTCNECLINHTHAVINCTCNCNGATATLSRL